MKRHTYTVHEGKKDHKCEDCGKSYYFANHLQAHISAIHKENKEKCALCGKSYSFLDNLKRHVRTKHKVGDDGEKLNF